MGSEHHKPHEKLPGIYRSSTGWVINIWACQLVC